MTVRIALVISLGLVFTGCPETSTPPPTDGGDRVDGGGVDGGGVDAAGTDGGGGGTDGGGTTDDGGGGTDGGGTTDDGGGGGTDGGGLCTGGSECTGFPTTIERGCTLGVGGTDVNCAAEAHQIDCCGSMRVIGINHGVVGTTFCPAETACRAMYPAAACDPQPYLLDTGETTNDANRVHVRCNIPSGATVGTCETYLGPPSGGIGSCG